MRLKALASLLATAVALIAAGVATWTVGGALIVAGVGVALWAWLILGETA